MRKHNLRRTRCRLCWCRHGKTYRAAFQPIRKPRINQRLNHPLVHGTLKRPCSHVRAVPVNLANMVRCAEVFPDAKILHALSAKLSWTHLRRIIYLDDPLKRDFYAEMCRLEQWNTRTLNQKIQSMLFERTAMSKGPDKLMATELKKLRDEDKLSPDLVFRDPYLLDFLGLKDTYAESDLEAAILREIETFILEIGVGFCFVARQKPMQIDGRDYYLDLLFYHRKLRRLVAIELKVGDFEAADKGQMELYLSWLKRYECEPDEGEPLGMILCAGKTDEHV